MSNKIYSLTNPQMESVEPSEHIWLSAAAGTGKTQVLSARVLRLLLQKDVKPEDILCITFTKAGAAEMANRINKRLASWVRMEATRLAKELLSIGADHGVESQGRARQLFAALLDAPAGGLRIMTIHSFCQTLLASFPGEASLNANFRAMSEREQTILFRDAFDNMCQARTDDLEFTAALEALSLNHAEDGAKKFLQRCTQAPDAMDFWQYGKDGETMALHIVDCKVVGELDEYLIYVCSDENIDLDSLKRCAILNAQWATKSGSKRADDISRWLGRSPKDRANNINEIHHCWSTKTNTIAQSTPKPKEDYLAVVEPLFDWSMGIIEQIKLYGLAKRLHANFTVGKEYNYHYKLMKESQGLVDYDDLIRKSANLLNSANMADWIRYKLDQRIDHILIDEAQDTNQSQWDIIKALSDDFYSGETSHNNKLRTIFTVGDYKQAIFGFQGTSPENYSEARSYFIQKLQDADLALTNLVLSQSFRSTKPILDFVNKVIEKQSHEAFGLSDRVEDHFGEKPDIGEILLLDPVVGRESDSPNDDEKWLSEEKRVLANRLADQIAIWLVEKPILHTTGQPLKASDIMILLRKRGDLASLIVARLHAKNIPVAGIDRLFLSKPLAVQDLLAAVKFVLQPDDSLNLAALLTSPLIGLNHDELLKHGYRKQKISLWQHIKRDASLHHQIEILQSLLAIADYGSPYQFLEQILSGKIQGRKKLFSRLGYEAEVAINELLNKALEYCKEEGQSLQGFVDWMVRGDVEVKRENNVQYNEVRVMTVHGSKGLQAPIVILADICVDPQKGPDSSFDIKLGNDVKLPMPSLDNENRIGRIKEAWDIEKAREHEEHNRLLYVALTRSEERLVFTGSIGKGTPNERSWYHTLENAMQNMGCEWEDDPIWGKKKVYKGSKQASLDTSAAISPHVFHDDMFKDDVSWLFEPPPQESKPPKPLAPSKIIYDDVPSAPIREDIKKFAERGNLIHNLFEYLANKKDMNLYSVAKKWYDNQHIVSGWSEDDIINPVVNIMSDPLFKPYFGANSRSEVPIVAVVGETVINGRIDHLIVEDDEVIAIDFKTGVNVPSNVENVATAHLRQMAHYAAALETIFPDKLIKTALLFTNAPKIMILNDNDINDYKPNIADMV